MTLRVATKDGAPMFFVDDMELRPATEAEQRAHELLGSASKLIDEQRFKEAETQIDEAASILGETFREVVSLRTMLHFLAT